MASTAIERILGRASGESSLRPGDVAVCTVDRVVLIDLQFRRFNGWVRPLKIEDPRRVAIIFDHAAPAPTVEDADAGTEARAFAHEFGVTDVVDIGDHGICHQIIAERGWARPGETLVCADSHTCAAGAFGCAARGLGPLEVLQVLCTGRTWFTVPETVRFRLHGSLAPMVTGKDVFLHLAGTQGAVAENRAIEFDGDGVRTLGFNERRVLATQGAELLADFTLFPCDDVTIAALRAAGVDDIDPLWSDHDAGVAHEASLDLATLEPQVGFPDRVVGNAGPISAAGRVRLDQCFIGSCANGQIEDLEIAARVLEGRHVATGCRLIVTPASQAVYREAVRRGFVSTLLDAGAVVTSSACGACFGYDLGVVGAGEVCLTASTRNFRGRMGSPHSRIYMASPATVAASAVAGEIVDPRTMDRRP